MTSQQPISLATLKEKFKTAREYMDNKMVPVDIIQQFSEFLKWVLQDPLATVYEVPDLKKFFFEVFVGGLSKRLSQLKEIDEEYQPLIKTIVLQFCDLFLKEIDRDNSDMADAMRYLFDLTSALHQNLFQTEENFQAQYDPSFIEKLHPEEREWRKSLEIGSKVDAIKLDLENNLKLWAKGEIIRIDGDIFTIAFENDNRQANRQFWWYSPEIDRYNTKSEGDEWRLDIKAGDLIDAFDSTKIWYASTIQDREVRQEDGKDVLYLRVGFRLFHPQGNKEDDNKNKYFGWSDRFDEWVIAYSPRIQKYQAFAKTFEEAQSQSQYEETVEDQMDMMLYSKSSTSQIFAVLRRRCKSGLLVAFLNRFGELGGYQKILERIDLDNNDQLGLETVYYYLDCLSKSTPLYNKAFLSDYLPQLERAVKKKILTANEQTLRTIKKDRIDGIVACLIQSLESRIKNYRAREQDKNLFILDIGCVFLQQNFLERRIDGAKIIQEVCKSTNILTYSSNSDSVYNNASNNLQILFIEEVIKKIQQNKVLYQMFSKERGHLQLVQRSEELLKLLIGQDKLTDEQIDLVWNSGKIDETTQLELYKVLGELTSRLRDKEINFIIEQINQIPLNKIVMSEIELVHELAKRSRTAEQQYGHKAVEFMWKIANSEELVDKVIVNHAALAFPDIIKNWENQDKLLYIERIVQGLQQNQEGFLCIKMLMRILRDFQGQPQNQKVDDINDECENVPMEDQVRDKFYNRSTFIDNIVQEYNLLEAFFSNFKHYMLKARNGLRIKQQQEPNTELKAFADKVLADKFIHSDQMNERLDFIKYLSQNSSVKISKEQLCILWEELVLYSMFQADTNLFYRWLKEVCDMHSQNCSVIEMNDLIDFFQNQILKETKVYQNIPVDGFNYVQSFFILLNEFNNKLIRLNQNGNYSGQQPVQKFTSYSNTTGQEFKSYSFNQNKNNESNNEDSDFQIISPPDQLFGIDAIWNIAIESTNYLVLEKANQFLIKLYTAVSYELEPQLPQFEDDFMKICIDQINNLRNIIKSRAEEPKDVYENVEKPLTQFSSIMTSVMQKVLPPEEKKILKYLVLIKDLIKNSEKDGTLGIRSHSAMFKGQYLHTLQIQNSLRSGSSKYLNKIEIGTYSNLTVWELRKLVGIYASRVYNEDGTFYQDTPCHPSTIRLYRYSGCTDIREEDNGKTLAELRFKPNEQLTAFRRNIYCSSRVPLLNIQKDDMSLRAKTVFTEWFYRYSVEDPDNPGHRVMTPYTCAAFTRSCTEDNCSEDDSRIVGLFAIYDLDQDGKIQLEDFLRFYRQCAMEKEEVVRQNLIAHSYRYDLKLQPQDGFPDNQMQIRKSINEMPRYKLSSTPYYFESLFELLLDKQQEVSQNAWNIIRTLTTNPYLYRKVIALDQDQGFQWDQIFGSESIYKMLYVLQIVEALLEEETTQLNSQEQQMSEEDILKNNWIERFLSIGGFQQILQLFHKSLDLLSNKNADLLTKFEKSFLEYMLKMIKIFILSAFSANDQSLYDVLSIVKKSSSVKQDLSQLEKDIQTNDQQEVSEQQQPQYQQDAYTTPAKQVKGKFVQKMQAKRVNFDYQPEITQDFLFGETLTDKPDPETAAHTQQEKKSEDKENKQADKESAQRGEEEEKRFSELAIIMKSTGLGEIILQKIDFQDLQCQVLEVFCLILAKKEITADDTSIVENALSLWVASLIKNESLIDDFYQFKRSEEKAGSMGIKNAEELIIGGMYTYKNFKVREEFCNTLTCICQKVKNNKGKRPLVYVLEIMKRNFPREDHYYATRECKQFFDLFISLVDEYFKDPQSIIYFNIKNCIGYMNEIDPFDLLKESIEKLRRHETKEKKGSILEDKTLIGYFSLIEKLIGYLQAIDKQRLSKLVEYSNLIHEVFYENLFYNPNISLSKVENKSKTKESRAASYTLLQKIIEVLEPMHLADFLENNLWPLIKDLQRPKKWRYVPSENSKTSQYVGIYNLGNICYMISMLQQFFMVPQFRYGLLRTIDPSPEDIKEYKGLKIDDSLLRQLQKMYGYLELSEKQNCDPAEFCFSFKDFEGNPTNTAIQADCQEFLNIFFDRVEELLKPTAQKYLLEGVFGGKVCSQMICQSCGNIRNILENFYNLSVPVKDRKGLEESLQKMTEGSLINDYKCEACNQKVDVERRSLIAETPNVLIIHLQRIIFNFDTYENEKINTRFEFPNVLNLKNVSFKSVMTAENRQEVLQSEDVKHLMDIQDEEYIYKLVGVTIHRGTAQHGHYYSLINTKRGEEEGDENKPEWLQTEKDQWKEFNDETVKYFSFSDLKTEAFGGYQGENINDNELNAYLVHSGTASSYGKNAYMLIYEKMKKKDLMEVVLQQESDVALEQDSQMMQIDNRPASLECANTATSRAATEEQISVNSKGERIKKIQYKKVNPYIPDWIKSMVTNDNSAFLIDRHIYHESFFNLLKFVFKHISNKVLLTQHHYNIDYIPHFNRLKRATLDIASKSMFDLLSYYYYNTQMSDINNSLLSIIQFCDSAYTISRGDGSMLLDFIQRSYLDDDCYHFFSIMFDCSDKTSRYYIGRLTSIIMNKAYQIYEDAQDKSNETLQKLKEAVDNFVIRCVRMLSTQECQKNWMKIEQFLKMIHDIGTAGPQQAHLLLTQFDIIVELIDFILGNRSPLAIQRGEKRVNMGSGQNSPPFEPIIALVCYLTRFSLTPTMRGEEHYWDEVINPPPSTLLGYQINKDKTQPEKYPLSQMGYEFIVQSGFIELVLKEGIQCEELGKVLAHFCYKVEKFSKEICKMLLHGISRNDYEKVKNYLDVVTQITLIRDEFQRKRLEWIFGYGSLICQTTTISKTNEENEVLTKVGIKCLLGVNDEPYSFRSALIYDSIDDALLHLLWRYKGRMDAYTVNCLFSLLNLIAADDNIAEYFSELPGPTYQYARYTDWIKPYLNEQLIDARKGYAGSFSAQKEETVVKCLSLYEKYDAYLNKKDGVQDQRENEQINQQQNDMNDMDNTAPQANYEENVKNLIEQSNEIGASIAKCDDSNIIQCKPTPYIIVDVAEEKEALTNYFDNVVLQITQLGCFYTESKPTGTGNLAIPQNLFRRSQQQYSINPKFQRRAQNTHQAKEQEMQEQATKNQFQFHGGNNTRQSKVIDQPDVEMNDADEFNQTDEKIQDGKIIMDDNKEWDMVNKMNVSDIDDTDQYNQQYQSDENNYQDVQNMNSNENQQYEHSQVQQQTFKIRVIEEGQEVGPNDEILVSTAMDAEPQNNNYNNDDPIYEDDEYQKDPQQVQWPQEILYSEDLVYRISVTNYRDHPVKVNLFFSEQEDIKANLYYPKGGLKAMVYAKQTKTLILLNKILPDNNPREIDRLNIEFYWKQKNRNNYNNTKNVQIYPMPPQTTKVIKTTDMEDTANQENEVKENINTNPQGLEQDYFNDMTYHKNNNVTATGDAEDFGATTNQDNDQIQSGVKQCPHCTFYNDAANTFCEACYQDF